MANITLFDLFTLNLNDPYTGLIEDVTTLPREWDTITAVPRDGIYYEICKRTTLPTAQFRQANQGVSTSKSAYKKEVKEMLFIDTILNIDEALWDADRGELGAVWQLEASGAAQSVGILIGQQTYYGTSADANGFYGLRSQFSGVVKAGGTTNSTSAYLIWDNPKEGVRYDVGRNASFQISQPVRQQILDSNSKPYFAYVGNLKGWVGLFVGSNLSVWGVTGIGTTIPGTAQPTNPLTDLQAQALVSNIPIKRRQGLKWYMNRTGIASLQASRSAVTPSTGVAQYQIASAGNGMPAYAPIPEMLVGYPIETTDSILNTETNS